MSWNDIGTRVDKGVSAAAERMLRKLSRRDAMRVGVVGTVAGFAAVALGQRPAFASTPKCSSCPGSGLDAYCCGPTYRCSHYGHTCPGAGCPSGYHACTPSSGCRNSQGEPCVYSSGNWVACNGAGRFGAGYFLCYDCVGPGGCYDWCTCLSECFCCNCTTPQDVRDEQKRLESMLAKQAAR
jgi:hypothetical protein